MLKELFSGNIYAMAGAAFIVWMYQQIKSDLSIHTKEATERRERALVAYTRLYLALVDGAKPDTDEVGETAAIAVHSSELAPGPFQLHRLRSTQELVVSRRSSDTPAV